MLLLNILMDCLSIGYTLFHSVVIPDKSKTSESKMKNFHYYVNIISKTKRQVTGASRIPKMMTFCTTLLIFFLDSKNLNHTTLLHEINATIIITRPLF